MCYAGTDVKNVASLLHFRRKDGWRKEPLYTVFGLGHHSCRFVHHTTRDKQPTFARKSRWCQEDNGRVSHRTPMRQRKNKWKFNSFTKSTVYWIIFLRRVILAKMTPGRCVNCSLSPIFAFEGMSIETYCSALFCAVCIFSDWEEVANSAKIKLRENSRYTVFI